MSDIKYIDNKVKEYHKVNNSLLLEIKKYLKLFLDFEVEENNGMLNFEMGGCGYNLYLSRGYIVFEAEDNSTIDNVYTVDSFGELVDLIKDLAEDV